MNKLEILVLVVILSLVGVIIFQQYQMSGLYGANKELALSNQQKGNEYDELVSQHSQLNTSYQQVLSNLEQVIDTLDRNNANFTSLQKDYLSQITSLQEDYLSQITHLQQDCLNSNASYNSLSQSYNDLKDVAVELCDSYGATDGIFIVDYRYSFGTVGMTSTYLANMTLYNALLTANVTVKVYGLKGTTKTFTYTIPSGVTVNKVEGWSGGAFAEDYDYIMIENVNRKW